MGCLTAGSILVPLVSLRETVPGPGTEPKKAASAFLVNREKKKTDSPALPMSFKNMRRSKSKPGMNRPSSIVCFSGRDSLGRTWILGK